MNYTINSKRAKHLTVNEEPARSPLKLLQESYTDDTWKLLNMTSGKQVRTVITDFFQQFPSPNHVTDASEQSIIKIIKPLGLWKKRAVSIKLFSKQYLEEDWKYPIELHGIGKYGNDCYRMFCCGEVDQVTPEDHALRKYMYWLKNPHLDNKTIIETVNKQMGKKKTKRKYDEISEGSSDEEELESDSSGSEGTESEGQESSDTEDSLEISEEEVTVIEETQTVPVLEPEPEEVPTQSSSLYFSVVKTRLATRLETSMKKVVKQLKEKNPTRKPLAVLDPNTITRDNVSSSFKKQKIDVNSSRTELIPEQSQVSNDKENEKRKTGKKKPNSPGAVQQEVAYGWKIMVTQRSSGASAGKQDFYFISPNSKKFRSITELTRYFNKVQLSEAEEIVERMKKARENLRLVLEKGRQ